MITSNIPRGKEYVYGVHPVLEVLRTGKRKIHGVMMSLTRHRKGLEEINSICVKQGINITRLPGKKITNLLKLHNHQGVIALVDTPRYLDQQNFFKEFNGENNELFLMLDRIQDSGNLGGILRSAVAFHVNTVFMPREKSAKLTPTALKSSAGMAERIPLVLVDKVKKLLDNLKKHRFKIYALEAHEGKSIYQANLEKPLMCIVGGEDQGIRKIIKGNCHELLSIPMSQSVNSLSVPAAVAVILAEISRQNIHSK